MEKEIDLFKIKKQGFIHGKFGHTYDPPDKSKKEALTAYRRGFDIGYSWVLGYKDAKRGFDFDPESAESEDGYIVGYQAGEEEDQDWVSL